LHPSTFVVWFFLFYAGAAVVILVLPWALMTLTRRRDSLPILALIGGGLTSLLEPLWDTIGHLRWAPKNPMSFTNFGIHIPALIPPCYSLFMGLEAYWVYTILRRGCRVRHFMLAFAAVALSDAIMEHPGVNLDAYQYYGTQPFMFWPDKWPWYWAFINGASICTIGALIYFVWPRLQRRGWHKLAVLALGPIGMAMAEFTTGFPVFLSINANISSALAWVVGSLTLIFAVVWVRVLASLVTSQEAPDWSFWGLFKIRLLGPRARDRYLASIGAPTGAVSSWGPGEPPLPMQPFAVPGQAAVVAAATNGAATNGGAADGAGADGAAGNGDGARAPTANGAQTDGEVASNGADHAAQTSAGSRS
jgi:hypothetical protein